MSGTNENLRRRIGGARDLNSVVRAMKALAASSIGQYEKAVESLGHYYRTVELGMAACFRQDGRRPLPVTGSQGGGVHSGAVIFGSDQGLVGQFNESLVAFAANELGKTRGKLQKVWAVGERVQTLWADSGLMPATPLPVPNSVYGITPLVGRILIEIEGAREIGEVADVYVFHNRPKAGAVFEPASRRLLPLDDKWQNSLAALPWPTQNLPEVIEGERPALAAFIRSYLFVLLFQACAESLASENACRLAAMQRAEKNIGGILEGLNRTFHRNRQESIDEELFDVISGFEAKVHQTQE